MHGTITVLAFLQNQWFRDPALAKRSIDRLIAVGGESARRRFIARTLFMGCLTGRRIKAAFGDDVNRIVWEECSREIAAQASGCPMPDPTHIQQALFDVSPDIVLLFGAVARDAVLPYWKGETILAPHPAARQISVLTELRSAAEILRGKIGS